MSNDYQGEKVNRSVQTGDRTSDSCQNHELQRPHLSNDQNIKAVLPLRDHEKFHVKLQLILSSSKHVTKKFITLFL